MTRFLAAKASLATVDAASSPRAHVPPTLCARGWESLATPYRDLTFSVAEAVPHRGFQGLDAVFVRRKRAHEHHRARAEIRCAPVKERSAQQPRTPSIASSPPFGRANCLTLTFDSLVGQPDTLFTVRGGLAMSRTESQRTASTAYLLRPRAKGSPMRDAFSRSLQPTSIHEHPPISRLPSGALSRFRPMLRPPAHFACACTRWNRRARHRRRVTVAGGPDPR